MNTLERNWTKVAIASTACAVGAAAVVGYCWRQRHLSDKPQRRFRVLYADNSDTPFEHLAVGDRPEDDSASVALHPYVHEILALKQAETHPTLPMEPLGVRVAVPWIWVDTVKQLPALVDELNGLDCFALDTEFHKHRSYHGFTCLMQIFTGQCIYLIDAVALHDELHILNSVFSNPRIRKVLHGCHNDVIWLQQDFRIYLVNVFDTEKACQVLKKPKSNLAHLLEVYFDVKTDKSLQQADWRQRPLSGKQIEYAKLDVRYLLTLEHHLKEELMTSGELYKKAVQKSYDTTLNLFRKWTSEEAATAAALHLIRRYFDMAGKSLRQGDYDLTQEGPFMSTIYQLCLWRDAVARKDDESPEYILKNKILSLLAREMPTTSEQMLIRIRETPLYDYSSHEQRPIYWNPPRAFLKRTQKVVAAIDEVNSGCFIWSEGPALLDTSKKPGKWRSKGPDRERTVGIYCAKSKVYDNCKMLSLDGELLCYCDRRNLEWYVKKKIAKVESTDPFVIRLLFQHRTADEANGCHDFYVQSRVNCCVACGEEGHYLRYKIVPACYRKNFPVELKSHRSHDVVLLCIDCHHIAQTAADRLKRKIAEEYDIPLINGPKLETQEKSVHPTRVRAAALALYGEEVNKIPVERRIELEKTIHLYFGRDPKHHGVISAEDLKIAQLVGLNKRQLKKTMSQPSGSGLEIHLQSLPKSRLDSGEQLHGEQLVAKAMERGGEAELYNIIRRFREVFVESLQPQYLPKKWDIEHFAPRRFGEHSIFYSESKVTANSKSRRSSEGSTEGLNVYIAQEEQH